MTAATSYDSPPHSRQQMIDGHLRRRGIRDARVLAAMASVPRELFVPPSSVSMAYEDTALPISHGQTISQPYIVAYMTEALRLEPEDDVLEVGTGSGYAAAVLSTIARHVYTIERIPQLAETARERLETLGYRNIDVKCGDGTLGWPDRAPFQAIVCAANGPSVPRSLLEQLDIGGRLVMPIDTPNGQTLVRVRRRSNDEFTTTDLGAVQFVPLIGEQGWAP